VEQNCEPLVSPHAVSETVMAVEEIVKYILKTKVGGRLIYS
jgi:hypothetical protein